MFTFFTINFEPITLANTTRLPVLLPAFLSISFLKLWPTKKKKKKKPSLNQKRGSAKQIQEPKRVVETAPHCLIQFLCGPLLEHTSRRHLPTCVAQEHLGRVTMEELGEWGASWRRNREYRLGRCLHMWWDVLLARWTVVLEDFIFTSLLTSAQTRVKHEELWSFGGKYGFTVFSGIKGGECDANHRINSAQTILGWIVIEIFVFIMSIYPLGATGDHRVITQVGNYRDVIWGEKERKRNSQRLEKPRWFHLFHDLVLNQENMALKFQWFYC